MNVRIRSRRRKIVGKEPDVIVEDGDYPEIHEIEAIRIPYPKLFAYKQYQGKKVLWLVLPSGTKGIFKQVNILFGPDSRTFVQVPKTHV